jgi:hypothetical protein
MIGGRGAGLRLEESVIEDVERDDREGSQHEPTFGGHAGPHIRVGPLVQRSRRGLGHAEGAGAAGASTLSGEPPCSR